MMDCLSNIKPVGGFGRLSHHPAVELSGLVRVLPEEADTARAHLQPRAGHVAVGHVLHLQHLQLRHLAAALGHELDPVEALVRVARVLRLLDAAVFPGLQLRVPHGHHLLSHGERGPGQLAAQGRQLQHRALARETVAATGGRWCGFV